MAKLFFYLLVLSMVLLVAVGLMLQLLEPMPTENTPATEYVDDVALDRAILNRDAIALFRYLPFQKIRQIAPWFGFGLFVLLMLAFAFSKLQGTSPIARARWQEEDSRASQAKPVRRQPGSPSEEVVFHKIDRNNP